MGHAFLQGELCSLGVHIAYLIEQGTDPAVIADPLVVEVGIPPSAEAGATIGPGARCLELGGHPDQLGLPPGPGHDLHTHRQP
jgi:hypothetical protein